MLSRYWRIRKKDGVVAIFHELHPDPVYCSEKEFEELADKRPEMQSVLTDRLRERKLLICVPADDDSEFKAVACALEHKLSRPTILYLMTAQGCNFGCGYCPVPETARRLGETMLRPEDAVAGIDLWLEHVREAPDQELPLSIIFYGGEPLLNPETIKGSLKHLESLGPELLPPYLNLMIVTNGACINEETIGLCLKHKIMVAVGLDGPAAVNDVYRVDQNGQKTGSQTITVIHKLVERGVRTFASVSITPANIDQVADYSAFFEELGVEKFGFNFLKGRKLLELVGREGVTDYCRRAVRGVIANFSHQRKADFEYQMEKKRIAFDQKNFFPVDCTCYGNQLVIQPDGQISNCPFLRANLGQVREVGKDFRIWRQPIVGEWRRRLPLYHPGEAKALSGGGCVWSVSEIMGDLQAEDEVSRIFSEEVLDELIWLRYTETRE